MIETIGKVTRIYTDVSSISSELIDVLKLFIRNGEFLECTDKTIADIVHEFHQNNNYYVNHIYFAGMELENKFILPNNCSEIEFKRLLKRYAKLAVYQICVKIFGLHMPWGALTGIRPTKLAWEYCQNGDDYKKIFSDFFDVSREKIDLVDKILTLQKPYRNTLPKEVDIYVGIPFCLTRCSYCSFTGGEITKMQQYVKPYYDTLSKEIKATLDIVKRGNYKIKNIYFGGGTPTALPLEYLEGIISLFDNLEKNEFTIEAGRPDTIMQRTFEVFKHHGVNRISINPQTFSQKILDNIGRRHTVEEVFEKYGQAKSMGFLINMDFIAGLPYQTFEDFRFDISTVIGLAPDNVTIHTLALKKGTFLKENTKEVSADGGVKLMVDHAYSQLISAGYAPYYMYRQKYMADNLENIGYCKSGKECVYNIDMMEETTNILACGSNSISKRIFFDENRLERVGSQKDLLTYINGIDETIAKKEELFLNK